MEIFMKHWIYKLFFVLLLLNATPASAIIIDGGPAWPGSADTSGVSTNGVDPTLGTNTWTYPNIGNSAVANLYFGLDSSLSNQGFSMDGVGITGSEIFTWFADTVNSIEYHGRTTARTPNGSLSVTTRLLLTATGASVVSDATTQALGNNVHSLFHITSNSFTIDREVQAWTGSVWIGANTYFNNINSFGSTQSSFSTAFYWEDIASAPEPSVLALIGLGLAGLGFRRKLTV